MINKKSFIAFFLLSLFLYPQTEKWVHRHYVEKKVFKASSSSSIYEAQEKCAICHFEFSIFQLVQQKFHFWNDIQIAYQYILSYSAIILDVFIHQSERGPPVV